MCKSLNCEIDSFCVSTACFYPSTTVSYTRTHCASVICRVHTITCADCPLLYSEILYEQEDFPERELSALLASKVCMSVSLCIASSVYHVSVWCFGSAFVCCVLIT